MTRHPDPHIAMGETLRAAREAMGPTIPRRDIPSRVDMFDMVPETDEDSRAARLVYLVFTAAILTTVAIIAVTNWMVW